MPGNPDRLGIAVLVAVCGLAPAAAEPAEHRSERLPADPVVVDQAGVVDAGTQQRWRAWFSAVKEQSGARLRVITRRDPLPEGVDAFTKRAYDQWLGDRAPSDLGVLIVLALAERRVQVQVGRGLDSALPQPWLAATKSEMAREYFGRGEYSRGLDELVVRVLNRIAREMLLEIEGLPERQGAIPAARRRTFPWWILGLVAALVILAVLQARRRRRRSCETWADSEGFGASFPSGGFPDAGSGQGDRKRGPSSRGKGW